MRQWQGSAAVLCMFLLTACHGGSAASESSGRTGAKDSAAPASGEGSSLMSAFRPAPLVLPEGTPLPLVLQTALSSDPSHPGDLVVATLASDVRVGEKAV